MTPFVHPFDQAIELARAGDGTFSGRTSTHYWNAISPFGGTTVATLLQAMLAHPQRLGDPLSMTVNFAGPLQPGEFTVRVTVARAGRSTQHWQMEIRQAGDEQPAVTGTAVFAVRRETWSDTEATLPDVLPPGQLARYAPPVQVPFLQMYDIRYVDCDPLAGGPDSTTQCWISDVPPRRLDFPAIAAYCDSFVPRLFVRKGAARPISTVTLSINFHVDDAALARQQGRHAFGKARANAFNGGYYDQEGQLWAEDGTLLATTHQLVWFRE
ncbi:acyl-CoA thioesterase II [Noviherbaspirillum sp. UKPF54]|uniref:acyl-CoA thioesterase n=1 Tax=Noviherbaspirillum sp. UKPF54 TaxID=2601898 RepID=UPI0011B15884|nr:thioesterase family protein [Noviherbaspirillum sp. UKPF54]QDZ29971.1 thioesterase family protein [Noviherbaspirillum sp. UKPF54]